MGRRLQFLGACALTAVAMLLAGRVAGGNLAAQMPSQSYERAQRLLAANLEGLVLNAYVVPHWIGESDEFWYRQERGDGHEFVVVDAASGARRPTFDHQKLAEALSAATGKPHTATRLPFSEFTFGAQGAEVHFAAEGLEYTVRLSDSEVRTRRLSAPMPGVVLSADGRWGAMTRRGDLWVRDMATGAERALTQDGGEHAGYGIQADGYQTNFIPRAKQARPSPPVGLRWSPDGARIFVPYFDQRHVLAYPFLDSAPDDASLRPQLHEVRIALVGERPATVDWYAIDVATGAKRRVALPTDKLLKMQADILPITEAFWTRDGAHLFAVAHGDNMESAYLFDIDVATGQVRTVIEDRVLPRTDLNTTTYNLPNVWVSDDGADAIWFSQRDGWGHLYLYDARTGALRNRLTKGNWLVREIIKVDREARIVYFTGSGREGGHPYHRHLYRVNFDGSDLRLLTPEKADHLLMPRQRLLYSPDGITLHDPISPGGKYVVYTYSSVNQPPVCVLASTGDGRRIATVAKADATALYAAGWRAPAEFVAKAADGKTDIYGVIYTPSDLDSTRKYPVLDAQYASPLISVAPHNFYQSYAQNPGLDQAAYAELGFVVVTLDGRGTTNRSKEFSHVTYGELNRNGLQDHVAAIEQLAAQRPYMDVSRVGVYGVSYGGYMSVRAMLEFPEFFKAGISMAGIAVMPGMYADYHWSAFQGRPRYVDGGELLTRPGEIPVNWTELDARRQAHRLQGKLFIVLSELDENVPPGQMMAFIDALMTHNKHFDMLHLPGRDHSVSGDPYVLRRNWDFLVRNLQGREPPRDFRIQVRSP